jgi:hypothetical protein
MARFRDNPRRPSNPLRGGLRAKSLKRPPRPRPRTQAGLIEALRIAMSDVTSAGAGASDLL